MLVIYQIRNLANNNRYVGSSRNVQQRFSAHKKTLNNNTHHCIGLQRSWNKYGKNNFIFEIIREVDLEENLLIEEQIEIDKYKIGVNLYNSNPKAENPPIFKGEDVHNACLTTRQAKEIREYYNEFDDINTTTLSNMYNVNSSVIRDVVMNHTYYDKNYVSKDSYSYKSQVIHSGAEHHNAKFNWDEIKQIRDEYNNTNITLEKLAEKWNYDSVNLVRIIYNKMYIDKNYKPKESYKYRISNMTQEIANQIRQDFIKGIPVSKLTKEYNIPVQTLYDIIRNVSWKDSKYIYQKSSSNLTNNKLNWELVNKIRKEYKEDKKSIRQLYESYNVTKTTIATLLKNKSWYDENYIP